MKQKRFGFVVLAENICDFKKNIESILNFNYNLDLLEIVVINSNDDAEIFDNCKLLKNKVNIKCLKSNKYVPEMYNVAISEMKAEYVSFINDKMYYSRKNILKYINNNFSNELINIKLIYHDKDTNELIPYKMQPQKSVMIDLNESPFSLSMHLESFFIPLEIAQKIKFDKKYETEFLTKFLIDLYKEIQVYTFIEEFDLISNEPFEDNTSKCSIQYQKEWYIQSLENLIIPELQQYDNKDVPLYLQEIVLYLIHAKYNCNIHDRNKGILSETEYDEFSNLVTKILLKIDDNLLLQNKNKYYNKKIVNNYKHYFKIPKWLRLVLLENKIKYLNSEKNIRIMETSYGNRSSFLFYKTNILKVCNDKSNKIVIQAINYKKGKLYFDCTTTIRDYLYEKDINIYIKNKDKQINIIKKDFYPLLKAFGKTLTRKYAFSFSIDIKDIKEDRIEAHALIDGQDLLLEFSFSKVQARLSNSKRSFWHFENYILYNKKQYLIITNYKKSKLIMSEILFDLSKLKNEKNKIRVCKLIFLRMLYYLTRIFYKDKHIWLTWDKLYKAGDNGEYIYQYGLKHGKNIYYIIKKDAPDYKRLVKQNKKHIIIYNSLKSKLLSLHSEVILKTHANVISYCGFEGISRDFVCGLFNPEIIEIQHGLTIQKIAQFQNRLFDNVKHYCCASQFEVDNILGKLYDYDKSQITLTGLARYDGLKSKNKKIILITPTWRRNVVNSSVAHIKKKHNDNFKNSEYFRLYNNLINDDKLINTARETGYKIIYLLHPAMSGQLEDFDKNKYVEIIPATGDMNYEKILTESSLMVTDYSGVQFDFAYQRKALIYYHPDTLPPHYDAGGLEYETMGFGPICKTEDSIINELCNYMHNDCKVENKYKKRADDFFAFDDFNNCKRIIETVDKYLKEVR